MTTKDPLYEGIFEFGDYTGNIQETCDVVVVGSGPTGAVSAYNLAAKGLNVILLEAGPIRRPQDFTTDGGRTLAEVCYEGGLRAMRGTSAMPTMQARVLGGGSHINSAICVRTPQFCFDDWKQGYGVDGITRAILDPHYDRVERFLGVAPTPEDAMGAKNLLFKKACDALGISSEPMPRNVVGCCGCAECFTGCPTRAKKSMDISYIPAAVKLGLRVYTSIQAREVIHDGKRATGIRGVVSDPRTQKAGHTATFKAKTVILAAGCIATPVLLQKSGVPDPQKLIGDNLQAHPGCAIMGIFPDPVNPWEGATQGYQSLAHLQDGFKLEVLWAPPAVMAVRFPDFGQQLKTHFANFKYSAFWDSFFALKRSKGKVRGLPGKSMRPDVSYNVHPDDMATVKAGVVRLAEMFFAAGAEKILPGLYGVPAVIEKSQGIDAIVNANLKPTDVVLAATHLFSTTRMGPDRDNSVVREDGSMHRLDNCYIVDTGIMPRSPAVNPMLTGMALADRISLGIAATV